VLANGIHYRYLDFPALPLELEEECLNSTKDKNNLIFSFSDRFNAVTHSMAYYGKLVIKRQCLFEVYKCPMLVRQWLLQNNIIDNLQSRVAIQKSHNGNVLLPHVDNGPNYKVPGVDAINTNNYRTSARNYLLTNSGPRTCFYNSDRIDDILEYVTLPKGRWHELDVDILHGVEDIDSDRISLSVSFY
jgi:hypothetical protein